MSDARHAPNWSIQADNAKRLVVKPPTCQEVVGELGNRPLRCGAFATWLVDNGDRTLYYMCPGCASHNVNNRGAKLIALLSYDV